MQQLRKEFEELKKRVDNLEQSIRSRNSIYDDHEEIISMLRPIGPIKSKPSEIIPPSKEQLDEMMEKLKKGGFLIKDNRNDKDED